jgi:hypothetical protein
VDWKLTVSSAFPTMRRHYFVVGDPSGAYFGKMVVGEDKRRARNNEMRNGWASLKYVTVLWRKQRDETTAIKVTTYNASITM